MEPKNQAIEQFRSSLSDAVTIMDKLAPLCSSVREMQELLHLATENEAQLRLLISVIMKK